MDDRHWMYTGRPSQASMTDELIRKTNDILEAAWSQAEGSSFLWCPCNRCGNKKRKTKKVMAQQLCKYGFTPDYTRWTFHGEAHRMRDEVVRQRIDDCDADARVGDMLHDYHEAHFGEGPYTARKPCINDPRITGHTMCGRRVASGVYPGAAQESRRRHLEASLLICACGR